MVAVVPRVGVDLAGGREDEARLAGDLADIGLLDVAGRGHGVLHAAGPAAMFLHAQDPAGPERRQGVAERLLDDSGGHPVVQVPQEQHHVRRAGGRDRAAGGPEGGYADAAIEVGTRRQPTLVGLDHRLGRRLGGLQVGGVEPSSGGREERGEDVGVPAGAGPELDHRHAGLQTPELQALQGMAPAVARLVHGRSPVARDSPLQRSCGDPRAGRRAAHSLRLSPATDQGQGGASDEDSAARSCRVPGAGHSLTSGRPQTGPTPPRLDWPARRVKASTGLPRPVRRACGTGGSCNRSRRSYRTWRGRNSGPAADRRPTTAGSAAGSRRRRGGPWSPLDWR